MSKYLANQSSGTDVTATSTSGATFVSLANHDADEVTLIVTSAGTGLDIVIGTDQTKFVSIDAPSGFTIPLCGNTQEVQVRRTDLNNTSYNVRYLWRKFSR